MTSAAQLLTVNLAASHRPIPHQRNHPQHHHGVSPLSLASPLGVQEGQSRRCLKIISEKIQMLVNSNIISIFENTFLSNLTCKWKLRFHQLLNSTPSL